MEEQGQSSRSLKLGIVKTLTCHSRSTGNTMAHDYCGFQDKALTSSHWFLAQQEIQVGRLNKWFLTIVYHFWGISSCNRSFLYMCVFLWCLWMLVWYFYFFPDVSWQSGLWVQWTAAVSESGPEGGGTLERSSGSSHHLRETDLW